MEAKRVAAERAIDEVKEGMVIGLGTGSTSYRAIKKLGDKVKNGFNVKAVVTSVETEKLALELQIPMAAFSEIDTIDITIDGADEVDKMGNLIKGGGGALLREKIAAYNSKRFIVIIDNSKLVDTLGTFLLPVEISSFAHELTVHKLTQLGGNPVIRHKNGDYFITDNGNLIADCNFYPINDPGLLNTQLHMIAGVMETGLFLSNMVAEIIIGYENGTCKIVKSIEGKLSLNNLVKVKE